MEAKQDKPQRKSGPSGPAELEAYVATLYSILGYSVRTNVPLGGQQIDVLVERHLEGVGVTRIIVECKYKTSGSVSNQDVFDTINAFATLTQPHSISHCVIVTNTQFSQQAQVAAANDSRFKLVQLNQLEDDLVNIADSLLAIKKGYEAEGIFHEFLPQSAHGRLPYATDDTPISNVLASILQWIESYGDGFLTVLGDFGGGKTTLLRRIEYEFSVRFLEKKTRHRPLYLTLKDYSFYNGLDEFVENSVRQKYQRVLPNKTFWTLASEGGFVFLLDGFDEIVSGSDRAERNNTFLSLHRIITSGSPTVLTCRPAYFVSNEELNGLIADVNKKDAQKPPTLPGKWDANLFNTRETGVISRTGEFLFSKYVDNREFERLLNISNTVINLEVFKPTQINEYLNKFNDDFQMMVGMNSLEVKNEIANIYDLTDLMKRPIMLSMIKDTILKGQIDIRKSNVIGGAYSLYETYTGINLKRDWGKGKGRKLLNENQRREYAQLIAMAIFKSGSPEVEYEDILELSKLSLHGPNPISLELNAHTAETVASDIQVTTFLSRNGSSFRFAHRSFMEFFVARAIVDKFDNNRALVALLGEAYSREILAFVGEAISVQPSHLSRMLEIFRRESNSAKAKYDTGPVVRRNVVGILICAIGDIDQDFFSGGKLWEVSFRKRLVSGLSIRNAMWDYCGWQDVGFSRSSVSQSVFTGWRVEGGDWLDVNVQAKFSDCHFENVNFDNCSIAISGQRTVFQACRFKFGAMTLRGEYQLDSCEFRAVSVSMDGMAGAISRLTGCKFSSCEISDASGPQARPLLIDRCSFEDCKFLGFSPSSTFVERLLYENEVFSKGLQVGEERRIVMTGSTGIIFVDEFDDRIKIGKRGFRFVGDIALVAQRIMLSNQKHRIAFVKAIRTRLKRHPEVLTRLVATHTPIFKIPEAIVAASAVVSSG